MRSRSAPLVRSVAAATFAFTLIVLVAGGCGKDGSNASKPPASTTTTIPASKFDDKTSEQAVDVSVIDNDFEPTYLKVTAGAKVTWTNDGRNKHNIIPTSTGSFDGTTTLDPNQDHSAVFTKPGDYPYYCSIHGTPTSGQRGWIRVVAADGSAS